MAENITEPTKHIVKRKGNNPKGIGGFNHVDVQPGDNTRYLRNTLEIYNLPSIDISNAKQVEERINWYFEHCVQNDMKPTVSGMSMALGIDRSTLYDWSRGITRGVTHTDIVKRAMNVLAALWEDYMLNGKINPVSGIFLGKNHFGYTDQKEIVVEPKNALGNAEDPEDIKQRYLEENFDDNAEGE